ncbi:MAG: septum formation initiator family protein [Bacteroidales bacterium]|nr:septum formation initiator family protein [Bacteroidales bacterium]
MDNFSSIRKFIGRYKYIITLVVFGVIIVFLDENSILRRMEVANEARNTRNEIEKYRQEFEESTQRLNELDADSNSIERIAREKYLMKKPNEDIYVFEEDLEK